MYFVLDKYRNINKLKLKSGLGKQTSEGDKDCLWVGMSQFLWNCQVSDSIIASHYTFKIMKCK